MTLAIELSRLMLPYLVLAGPVAVLMGVLNANHRYSTAALAAVTFNVVVLCAIAVVIVAALGRQRPFGLARGCRGRAGGAVPAGAGRDRGLGRAGKGDAARRAAARRCDAVCGARDPRPARERHSAAHHDRRRR